MNLSNIVSTLGKVSACRFKVMLLSWYKRHELFLNKKVSSETKRGWYYEHRRLRSAHRSLMKFLPYLFTYQTYSNFNIPTTTNHLDGGCFSPLKDLLRVHKVIGVKMKRKLIVYFLENRVK